MEQTVQTILADVLEMSANEITDSITMDNTPTWDSLKHMELVVALEQRFNIELGPDEFLEMTSLKNIRRILTEKGIAC
jgi:acyl carrier protein